METKVPLPISEDPLPSARRKRDPPISEMTPEELSQTMTDIAMGLDVLTPDENIEDLKRRLKSARARRTQSPQYRYQHDPMFHKLVSTIAGLLDECEMTPSEVRQAAVLACQIHEERNVRIQFERHAK